MANKSKPNFTRIKGAPKKGASNRSGGGGYSKAQDSRKVHDTKGKNKHGRKSW